MVLREEVSGSRSLPPAIPLRPSLSPAVTFLVQLEIERKLRVLLTKEKEKAEVGPHAMQASHAACSHACAPGCSTYAPKQQLPAAGRGNSGHGLVYRSVDAAVSIAASNPVHLSFLYNNESYKSTQEWADTTGLGSSLKRGVSWGTWLSSMVQGGRQEQRVGTACCCHMPCKHRHQKLFHE